MPETLVYQEHAGPLPAPWVIEQYEQVQQGSADRIIAMAERQQLHSNSMEKRAVGLALTGQILAFLVVLAGLFAGTWLLATDKSLWGAAATIVPFASLAGLFVLRRAGDRRQLKGERVAPPRADHQA